MVIEEEPFGIARTRKPALGIVALAISGGAVALAIDAAFLMLADTGDSGGSQFVLALRASTLAALTIVAAICLSVTAILQRQGLAGGRDRRVRARAAGSTRTSRSRLDRTGHLDPGHIAGEASARGLSVAAKSASQARTACGFAQRY